MWKSRRLRVVTIAVSIALAGTAGAVLAGVGGPQEKVFHDVVLPVSDPPAEPATTTTTTITATLPSVTATTTGRPGTTSSTRATSTTTSTAPAASPVTVATTPSTISTPPPTFPGAAPADSEVAFACTPDAVTLPKDQTVTVSCTATSVKGYLGWVHFACSPTDPAIVCGPPAPFELAPGQSRVVAFQLSSRQPYSPEGQRVTVSITAYPNGAQRRRTVMVSASIPGVHLACTPGDVSFSYYGPTVTDCTVASHFGFAGAVTPACDGLPDGLYCSMPNSVSVPANGTETFRITFGRSSQVTSGTYGFYVVLTGTPTLMTLYHLTVP